MGCSARRLGQHLLGTPSVPRKALAREGESQVGRMSSQHGQQRFPALAFPLSPFLSLFCGALGVTLQD